MAEAEPLPPWPILTTTPPGSPNNQTSLPPVISMPTSILAHLLLAPLQPSALSPPPAPSPPLGPSALAPSQPPAHSLLAPSPPLPLLAHANMLPAHPKVQQTPATPGNSQDTVATHITLVKPAPALAPAAPAPAPAPALAAQWSQMSATPMPGESSLQLPDCRMTCSLSQSASSSRMDVDERSSQKCKGSVLEDTEWQSRRTRS